MDGTYGYLLTLLTLRSITPAESGKECLVVVALSGAPPQQDWVSLKEVST